MKKKINIRDEFIKLGQAVKLSGEAFTGVDAKYLIEDGKVSVNGEVEKRRGRKLYNGDIFTLNGNEITVISNAENNK
ncbi:MAG: RNA-binding S4 domain-containing protein [Lachnospiraceae bacterium]|nr:RNA-binding S4 domain-containing protein [Lachnospiraceae bacterium]